MIEGTRAGGLSVVDDDVVGRARMIVFGSSLRLYYSVPLLWNQTIFLARLRTVALRGT